MRQVRWTRRQKEITEIKDKENINFVRIVRLVKQLMKFVPNTFIKLETTAICLQRLEGGSSCWNRVHPFSFKPVSSLNYRLFSFSLLSCDRHGLFYTENIYCSTSLSLCSLEKYTRLYASVPKANSRHGLWVGTCCFS